MYSNQKTTSSSQNHPEKPLKKPSKNSKNSKTSKSLSKEQRLLQKQERENLVIWKSPLKTPYYFIHEVFDLLGHYFYKLVTNSRAMATILSLLTLYYGSKQVSSLSPILDSVESKFTWGLYWVFLGVLSSVGLGTGLH